MLQPNKNSKGVVLLAEDDEDYFLLIRDAFMEAGVEVDLHWVRDGEELIDYLLQAPIPKFLMLDLNMPRKDGREALKELRTYPRLQELRVVVLTTSNNEEDRIFTESLGARFFRKPAHFTTLIKLLRSLSDEWM